MIGGIIIIFACFSAIALMMYQGIKAALERDEKETRLRYGVYAKKIAEKMYREKLRQTEYKVNVPVVYRNESNIKWR